jgi:polynucleotide 5'-kinase involved in rRNA processing
LRTLIKESFSKSYLDDGTDDHFNEKEITAMAYYLMRAADENLDERILEQREKTPEELKNSKLSLHEWQELSTTGVFTFKDLKATSKEQLEAAGWKKSIFRQRSIKKP